jgi:hypothetical protein
MKFETVLARLWKTFGDRPFTVREAALYLGYSAPDVPSRPHSPTSWGGSVSPIWRPRPPEKTRQHSKADLFRLLDMKLLRRTPASEGRPGRRPFAYRVSRKGQRYLEWLQGPGLLDAFKDFVAQCSGAGAVPAGDRLLRRLHALEGGPLYNTLLSALEHRLDALLYHPSVEASIAALREFAFACMLATSGAPLEMQLRSARLLSPYIYGHYVQGGSENAGGPPGTASDRALQIANLYAEGFKLGLQVGAKRGPSAHPEPGLEAVGDRTQESAREELKKRWKDADAEIFGPSDAKPPGPGQESPPGKPTTGADIQNLVRNLRFADEPSTWLTIQRIILPLAQGHTVTLRFPRPPLDIADSAGGGGGPPYVEVPLSRQGADLDSFLREVRGSSGRPGPVLEAIVRAFSRSAVPAAVSAFGDCVADTYLVQRVPRKVPVRRV